MQSKNIKFDKVTVWDSGTGAGGQTSTANFLSGLMKSLPPINELFEMTGMQLPEFLGKTNSESQVSAVQEETHDETAEKATTADAQ